MAVGFGVSDCFGDAGRGAQAAEAEWNVDIFIPANSQFNVYALYDVLTFSFEEYLARAVAGKAQPQRTSSILYVYCCTRYPQVRFRYLACRYCCRLLIVLYPAAPDMFL